MLHYLFLAALGLIFGSFITMLSYRMVNGGGYGGHSKCIKCRHSLSTLDLIPLLSYVFLAGRCRYCKARISPRYPLTELLTACAFAGLGGYWHDKFMLILLAAMTVALITMIVIDFEHMIIPDEIQLVLAIIGIIYAYYNNNPLILVILKPVGLLTIALALKYAFLFFMKKDGLGLGDVKFFAVAGLYLNITALSAFFLLSGLIGLVIAIIWRFLKKGELFPFGPALAFTLYLCVVFPSTENLTNILN